MKGTILYCLEETIIENYDMQTWSECVQACGYEKNKSFASQIRLNIDEEESINLFKGCARALNMELRQLFDLFGEYWCGAYAPSLYGAFYVGIMSTRKAIIKLDWVHDRVTRNVPDSKPPRFKYNWLQENLLEVEYLSERGLVDLFISLVKGLNRHFGDSCIITKKSEKLIDIEFLDEPGKTQVIYIE